MALTYAPSHPRPVTPITNTNPRPELGGGNTSSPASAARRRYMGDAVGTVSPHGLVTMLYDGLVSDLERAEAALGESNQPAAHDRLLRAQAIVFELRSGLKPELWDGGPALASLYAFFTQQLMQANIDHDIRKVAEVRRLVEPLRDAWHQAAAQLRGPH